MWIGVQKVGSDWLTSRGDILGPEQSDWAPGYPVDDPAKKCVGAAKSEGFKWVNGDCFLPRPYFCSLRQPACPFGHTWLPATKTSCYSVTSVGTWTNADSSYA